MQLERLVMRNFGPYRDAVVDFSEFAHTPLFLISGKTGSGKTTIFDALVFALYGTTTGDDRSGREMRATFAAPDAPTRVTLTFSHGGKQYTIWREPDQLLAKKRGAGLTNAPMRLSLTERQAGVELHEWTKVRDVAPRIETLLHLDADQFRQMILLPQGKFRQFLDAKSDDKEALLRHLFGTGLFEAWQQRLRQAARAKSAFVQEQTARLAALASQFAFGATAPAAGAPLPDQLKVMHARLDELAEAVATSTTAQAQAQQHFDAAVTAEAAGLALQAAYADRRAAEAELAAMDEAAPALTQARETLDQLTWVAAHQAQATQLASAQAALDQRAARLTALAQARPVAEQALAAAQQTRQELAAQADEIAATQRRADALEALRPQLEALVTQRAAVDRARAVQTRAQAAVDQQAVATAALADQQATTAAALAAVPDHQAALTEARTEQAATLPRVEQWQQRQAEQAHLAQAHTEATQVVASATKAAEAAQQAYARLHDAQLTQQIARLAAQLTPGQPCPVCGSRAHPHPVVALQADDTVTDAQVETADAARQAAQVDLATAEAQAVRLHQQRQEAAAGAAALAQQLTGAADGDVPAVAAQLQATVTTLTTQVNTEVAQREALTRTAADLTTQQQTQATQQEAATAAATQAAVALAQARGALTAAEAAVPADAPALADLEATLATLTATLAAHVAAQAANQEALATAQAELTRVTTTQAELRQQQADALAANAQAQQAFEAALTTRFGADARAQFDALRARLTERAALQAQVEAAQTARTRQTALLTHATAQIGTQPEPDVAALATAKSAAAATLAAAQAQQAAATQLAETNRQLVATIEADYAQNQQAMDEAAAMADLFEVVNGNNDAKLSLERYVLRAYLQRVLTVANTRLQTLSAGRYIFTLHQDPGSHRNDSGLEIDIYDDQIGAARSVHTLSGGESFIAALALALALGEVIQQESGGVSIDALFVDEGFGSLDSTSLATAMDALESLEGQSRMIGIISHVTELRESIPDQLQVIPTGTGESHLRTRHGLGR
ncbi:AAA family ATPase [Lacticaseibacillus absianus]|uniref:AAA family ATPase n=1 Tax=Lacticaseibacillus absianus TaxID=2729623 RepID=UPI0015C8446F|nr:SMC family ATPase [Lacticaseibacillus absianus]